MAQPECVVKGFCGSGYRRYSDLWMEYETLWSPFSCWKEERSEYVVICPIGFGCASVEAGWTSAHVGFPFVLSVSDHVVCEPIQVHCSAIGILQTVIGEILKYITINGSLG